MNDAITIALAGGGTGAGATTLTVALAVRAAAAGRRVAVLDADPCGGGIDVAFGLETEPGVRWEDLLGSRGALEGDRLVPRLPRHAAGPVVLSFGRQWCDLPEELLGRAVGALSEAHQLVLVDVGRSRLDIPDALPWDEVLLVARNTASGLAAAGATAQLLDRVPQLIVRGSVPALPAELTRALGMDVAGELPTDRHLAADSERGIAPGSRRRSEYVGRCDRLLRDLLLGDAAAA